MALLNLFARWRKNRDANVALIFALSSVPITFLTGMGVDYTLAIDRQVQLNGAADAAVLAAITPTMMTQTPDVAVQAATNTFNAEAASITGVTYQPSAVNVTVTTSGAKRVVTLAYAAQSQNTFAALLKMNTIAISGGAQGTGGQAPNINFYLVLDDSPSMAIAATQTGINTLMANTTAQDKPSGCGFGCHETHASGENPALGNPGGEDNYTLAQNLKITLRMDLVRTAAQNLMSTAQTAETTYNAQYQMAIYTFDQGFNTITPLTANLTTAASQAGTIQLETVYSNNWLTKTNNNNDMDTDIDNATGNINTIMPNPGSGTGIQNDQPQEVMFLVTDGVQDKIVGGARAQTPINLPNCTAIKARGIRIAVLYTVFLPLPTDSYYTGHVQAIQNNIAPALQACASPGLYYAVETGGDISAALATLFQYSVQTAYLSQ